jgi:predicted ArsR family transcriptional regulator
MNFRMNTPEDSDADRPIEDVGAVRDQTRTRVVTALRRGPRTLDQLVGELGLTRTAIRLQLAALERDRQVEWRGVQRGRTKPAHVYALTDGAEQQLSRAYVPVLTQLLHVLAARLTQTEFDGVMRDVGRALLAEHARPRGTLRERVNGASALLDQLGGLTEVEEEGADLIIKSHGCPLAAAAIHHAETCSAMESLVTEFVGSEVTQRCERGPRPRCRFQISGPVGDSAA